MWRSGTGGYGLFTRGWSAFNAKRSELHDKGFRLIDVGMSNEGGQIKYTGVWRSGSGANPFYKYSNFNDIRAKWDELDARGYTMVDIEAIRIGNTTHYAGVWR